MIPRVFLLLGWLVLQRPVVADNNKRTRRVLPLQHPRHLVERSLEGSGDGAQNTWDSQDGGSRTGRAKGFISEGLDVVKGRAAHNGGSYNSDGGGSQADSGDQWTSGDGGSLDHPPALAPVHHKSGPHAPSLSPIIHPSSDYAGKGKGLSKSKSKSSKSKSKGKGKGKEKGKGYRSEDIDEGARPIEGGPGMGGDEIHPPSAESPATSPMEPEEEVIELTPFGILFDLADGIGTPSSEEYGMAIEVTVGYLNTYMSLQFEGRDLEEFETVATSTIYRDGVPQIDFEAAATFESEDGNIPSMQALDNAVAQAFVGANLALYLSMLQNLPPGNAFSTVSGARLTNPVGTGRSSKSSLIGSVGTVGAAGIVGAIGAGGLFIFAIGFLVYDKKKRKPKMPGIGSQSTKINLNSARLDPYLNHEREETSTTACSESTGSGISRLLSGGGAIKTIQRAQKQEEDERSHTDRDDTKTHSDLGS